MKAQHTLATKTAPFQLFAFDSIGVPTNFYLHHKGTQYVRLNWVSKTKLWHCPNDGFGRTLNFDDAQMSKLVAENKIIYFGNPHTDDQRKAFHSVGRSRYGSKWDEMRAHLTRTITRGITASSKRLTSTDMEIITAYMRKQMPNYKQAA